MGYASKGVGGTALGLGIAGTVGLVNQLGSGCGNNGILGGLFGGNRGECYETKEAALLRQENAMLKSDKYTDQKLLEVYADTQRELKERDLIIRDLTIAATQNACKVDNIQKDVTRLQDITAVQNVELADIKVREAETNGRINAVAMTSKHRSDAIQREFEQALGCEVEARKTADQTIYDWTSCNFVRNKKVIPAEDICPSVVTSRDVVNYYLAGNTAQTPAATGGKCCVSNGVSGENLNTR